MFKSLDWIERLNMLQLILEQQNVEVFIGSIGNRMISLDIDTEHSCGFNGNILQINTKDIGEDDIACEAMVDVVNGDAPIWKDEGGSNVIPSNN